MGMAIEETTRRFVVGAYAAVPSARDEQEQFYAGLADRGIASALEIPFREDLFDPIEWQAEHFTHRFEDSVLTLIPGTMQRLGSSPTFGLASPVAEGRQAAIDHALIAVERAHRLNDLTSQRTISTLHVHSAPSVTAQEDAFAQSLSELKDRGLGLDLVIEHCDAYVPEYPGEKRFLTLETEARIARELGLRVTVNWGRSVIESRDAGRPREHVEKLVAAGVLGGVMISGAGGEDSVYGPGWADTHLPLVETEPVSWLTPDRVVECVEAARGHASYYGVKVQVPPTSSVSERLDILERTKEVMSL
ncbi:UDP-N-acetylglucosamine diphosphorylase [Corynebacterium pseudotuberculosis]|nr:UDP-N-acetylglucosamine diphosphorylase [Corynebacterium pseudotuberculosis]